jgi:ankyrin repeat protein
MQSSMAELAPNSRILSHERTLLNVASPISSFLTAYKPDHPFSWIADNLTYKAWFDNPDPQLLYVYGNAGTQEASEYIFYSLDEIHQASEKNEVVLYFNFDQSDLRYDSAQDMLSTFLAQTINHHPTLAEFVLLQFQRLRLDRSWNEFDLLIWFSYFRCRGQIDGVTCVISNFDECDDASRTQFIHNFNYIASVHERPWKIIVTTRQPGVLLEKLENWPSLDLDSAAANAETELREFPKLRPQLSIDKDLLEREVAELDRAGPLVRRVILEQARVRDEWPADTSFQSQFGSVTDITLTTILWRILNNIPDIILARSILAWVLYSFQRLTIWELATAVYIGSPEDRGTEACPPAEFTERIVGKIHTWFASILRIANNEVVVQDFQTRQALAELMTEEGSSMHKTITETCLNYLQRKDVKRLIEVEYIQPYSQADTDPLSMEGPTFQDHTNFCSYALPNWSKHFLLIPDHLRGPGMLDGFVKSKSVLLWSSAHWVLSLPIIRSARIFQSVYPIFTAVGLAKEAEPWCNGDEDLSPSLAEAALHGFDATLRALLDRARHPISYLQEALITAGSNGNQKNLLYLINHIKTNYEDFPWPTSLLHRAAWLGQCEVVSALLDLGVPADPEDSSQQSTPLHIAARNGHANVVEALLSNGADVKARAPYEQTALHIACANGHAPIVDLLAKAGADLNARDENNFTPLYEASLWGNFAPVKALVDLGADMSLGTSTEQGQGWTPLIVASEEGYVRTLHILLVGKADPNLPGPHGTPLHYAVRKGHVNICRLLMNYGADPNQAKLDPPILTQIFTNVKEAEVRLELLRILVENGAHVDATDRSKMSGLLHAATLGDIPCGEYLLGHGADISHADDDGRTALWIAVDNGHVEFVRLLLDKTGDRHRADQNEQAQLLRAVKYSEMTRLLLHHGVDPDVRSADGMTALMQAASISSPETVKVLLEYEATVDLEMRRTNDNVYGGWTALTFAALRGSSEVVQLLCEAEADVNHRLQNGSTPLHLSLGGQAMRTLMEFRPDIDIADNDDNLPLHYIEDWTPVENIRLLVHAGASLNRQNKEGCTPLCMALRKSNRAAAVYLIEHHANVNLASQTYGAPLHLACQLGLNTIPLLRQLVDAGADIDQASAMMVSLLLEKSAAPGIVDSMGRVPLHLATLRGIDNVKLLLAAGADLRARDKTGQSSLHWAAHARQVDVLSHVIELLSAAEEFDINDRDDDGWTALCWAARGCGTQFRGVGVAEQVAVIKLLIDRGADIGVQARFSGKELWTPLEIAQYSVARDEVLELLNPATAKKAGDKEIQEEPVADTRRAGTKAFLHVGYYCTVCFGVSGDNIWLVALDVWY